MSKYLPRAVKAIEFDGDLIRISVDRITVDNAVKFRTKEDAKTVFEKSEEILRAHNFKVEGLKDGSGDPVSLDTVYSAFYFNPLVTAGVRLLMETGEVPKEVLNPLEDNST